MVFDEGVEDNFTTTGEDQSNDLNETQFFSIIDSISQQCATINPGIDNTDFFQVFVKEYLRLPDHEDLEDCSIYIDERLTETDRGKIDEFCNRVIGIFNSSFGISLPEGNIYQLYCLYKIFVLNIVDYFTIYILGLQKIDADFVEDIPNWSELSFKYYLEKVNTLPVNENTKPQLINEYVNYILEYGLIPEAFLDVILLESAGNVEVSALYIESSNYRLTCDNSFFNLKLKNIFSSDIEDFVISKLISLL